MALERFVSIRGTPNRIVSDGALTFKGSERFLRKNEELDTNRVEKEYADIEWIWNPPYNPSAGGLFERMVKSTKEAMVKLWKGSHPNNTHLRTLISTVMARLNERPITPLSQAPEDMESLTPNHFLKSTPYVPLPPDPNNTKLVQHWNYVKHQERAFWSRFMNELIPMMESLPKWRKKRDKIYEGQMVLILDKTVTPTVWIKGRILETHEGSDGLVRSVTVKYTYNGKIVERIRQIAHAIANVRSKIRTPVQT